MTVIRHRGERHGNDGMARIAGGLSPSMSLPRRSSASIGAAISPDLAVFLICAQGLGLSNETFALLCLGSVFECGW